MNRDYESQAQGIERRTLEWMTNIHSQVSSGEMTATSAYSSLIGVEFVLVPYLSSETKQLLWDVVKGYRKLVTEEQRNERQAAEQAEALEAQKATAPVRTNTEWEKNAW